MTTKIFDDGTSISFSAPTAPAIPSDPGLLADPAILDVTTGVSYASISDAINGSGSGDLIKIPAGLYVATSTSPFPKITHDLTLQAVGGLAHLESPDPTAGEAILVTDANVTVDGLELSGAVVGDGNGAGIREESGSLTVLNSYIHDNQDGILTSGVLAGATLTIDHTEFNHNGSGSGQTHNLYAGQLDLVDITNSYFTDVVAGHEIKSRALDTIIENNRIQDGPSGTSSYDIDLPNGNVATIENSVIEKGPNSHNQALIHFGGEVSPVAGNSSLTITGNTVIDDRQSTPFVFDQANLPDGSIVVPTVTGNTFYGLPGGVGQVVQGASGDYTNNTFLPLSQEPTLDTSAPFALACYCAGTHIATEFGSVAIEALRKGDRILTLSGGELIAQPVKWIGRRRIDLTAHPRPEVVAPVRIRRDAFAENVPHTDLLLSPDHAVFVDGKLICAHQLINRTTIRQETDWTSVDYYHVELDRHAILLAEGLPAESYLDTGNRGFFGNSDEPLVLHPDLTDEAAYPTRKARSCAPFVSDEASVRPVWKRLADRAVAIGLPAPQRATTTDPDLRLSSIRLQRLGSRPVYQDGNLVIFVLLRGSREIRLLSRAQSPTEARPWLDDRRRLGIRVKRIVLRGPDELREIPMDHPALTKGWWDIERDGQMMSRWTNGDAVAPLPAMDGPVMLELHLSGQMIYVRRGRTREIASRRSTVVA
jgi:hypothetical protein